MIPEALRTAARGLRRQPAFVAVVVLSLASASRSTRRVYAMLDAIRAE